MPRFLGSLVAVAVAAALLAGWTSGSRAAPKTVGAPAASGTLTMTVGGDPGNLDPHLSIIAPAIAVNNFLYDALVYVSGPGTVSSGLARTWKVVSSKRVDFTLRSGVTCSDGSRLTASVVKRNIEFIANPANRSPLIGVGVPAGATVSANNGTGQIVVTSKVPNPFMLQGLALVDIVCAAGLDDRTKLTRGAIGSGPFRLVEAVSGDHYTVAARTGYRWGPGGATTAAPRLPARVVLRVVSNETTAANLVLTGGVNVAQIVGDERARLNRAGLFRRVLASSPVMFFFNQKAGRPAADARVRRALVQAVNLQQVGSVATSGRGIRATTLPNVQYTPCPGDSVTGTVPAYNPAAARAVLSSTAPSLKVIFPTDAGVSALSPAMELAQQQWLTAGARVTLSGTTSVALQGALFGTGDWDVAVLSIGVSTPAQLRPFFSGPSPVLNFSAIDNSTYRTATARAVRRVGRAGCRFWLEGERALFRAANLAPTSALSVGIYGNKATFTTNAGGVVPTSLRLTG